MTVAAAVVVPAHDIVQTRNCKTPECPYEAGKYDRGPYAYLCEERCIPAKRADLRARGQLGASSEGRRAASGAPLGLDSFEGRARALVPIGRKLDRAVARYRQHQQAGEPLRSAFEEAMRDWRAALQRIAGAEPPS